MIHAVSSKDYLLKCYNIHTDSAQHFILLFVLLGALPSSNFSNQLCLLLRLYHDVTSNLQFVLTPYLLAISEEDIH